MGWSRLRIELLGEPRVLHDGDVVALPASKKTRALLAYLVATGREHTRERLCSLLWDGPDDPRAQLRWSLWKLRDFVDSERTQRLVASREHVGFHAHGAEVDLHALRTALTGGVASASTTVLADAAALFRGDFLEGLDLESCLQFDAWCVAERESLRQLRVSVLATLVERFAAQPAEALRYARAWVAVDPVAEAAHVEVVRLLGELAMPREALQQYDTCVRILATELNARPSLRLEQLRMQITSVHAQAPAPPVVTPPAITPTPHALVGRDQELAALTGRMHDRLVLVTGEPGIGKTRLLEELARVVTEQGGCALAGRSYEPEQIRPYGTWIDALRSLPAALQTPDLAALIPQLSPTPAILDDRARLFDAVVRALTAAPKPTLLVLDDIHWLDDASAALLHFVARANTGALVALGARDEELADNAAALRVVRALRRTGTLENVRLGPLSLAATAELAPGADAAHVFEETEGNPLFAIELGRALARGEAGAIPETLAGLLAERLDRLDDRARTLVSWAAALGRSFSLDVLGRATAMPALELTTALEDLERRNVVRATVTGYDFAHDLVRRAAYAKLSAPRRRLCHGQIANVLEALPDPDNIFASDLARHAGLAGNDELAARACVAAGHRCLRLCAHAEGGELAERGRHHLLQLEPARRLPYEIELLWILVHTRGVRQVREVTAALTAAVAAAEAAGQRELVVRGYQARAVLQARTGNEQAAKSDASRAASEAHAVDPGYQVQMLAHSARCYIMLGEIRNARTALSEANAVAERHHVDHSERTFARGLLHYFDGDLDNATALLESTLVGLRERADRWRECDCLGNLAMIALECGRITEAAQRAEELAAVAEKMGGGSYEGPFATAISALARRAAGSSANVDDALQRLREIDAKAMLTDILAFLAELELTEQHPGEAVRYAKGALEFATATQIANDIARAGALYARAAHASGDVARARAQLAAAERAGAQVEISARTRHQISEARKALEGAR